MQPRYVKIDHFFTRHNATLDKLFTNCPTLFVEPERISPLGHSDHCYVVVKPISALPTVKRTSTSVRPYRDSAIITFGQWITDFDLQNISSDTSEDTVTKNYSYHQ